MADINYVGQIMWQSALNQSGIFYDLQNGQMCDPMSAINRLNSNTALMSMMLNSTSLKQVDAFFDATRAEECARFAGLDPDRPETVIPIKDVRSS